MLIVIFSIFYSQGAFCSKKCGVFLSEHLINSYADAGKVLSFEGEGDVSKSQKMTIMSWNIKNFSSIDYDEKISYRSFGRVIRRISPDLLFLQEVEFKQELIDFTQNILHNFYHVFMISNPDINISNAVLVKKSTSFDFQYKSFQNISPAQRVLTRDIPKLLLFKKGKDKPFLGISNLHLKAKNRGAQFDARRSNEIGAVLESGRITREHFEREIPSIYLGDFNSNDEDPAIVKLKKTLNLENIFDRFLENQITSKSYMIRRKKYKTDYFLLPIKNTKDGSIEVKNVTILNSEQAKQKMFNLSDHLPIVMEMNINI